ncbi:MAG: UTP--glucose-1-phosphate uridylyltransferase [Candidatus Poribacteria bacterium]|nr:UTP--glucose-1-phosphate uridylyltransferase [Candidatus Poribacteria bacterium]
MPIRKAVVPVSGFGTRLLPTTRALPKEMLPVGRHPTIHYVVEEMISAGVREILFITAHSKTIIADQFDNQTALINYLAQSGELALLGEFDYQARGISFFFIRQQSPPGVLKPQGTGAAIAAAEGFVGDEPFIVAYGDTIIDSALTPNYISRIVESHIVHQSVCTVGVRNVPREQISLYGAVAPAPSADPACGDLEISGIVEKPALADAPSSLAVNGRYIFGPEIFEEIRKVPLTSSGEIPVTPAIQNLIHRGCTVRAVQLAATEKRYDLGNHADYYRAFIDFALRDPDYGREIRAYIRTRAEHLPHNERKT